MGLDGDFIVDNIKNPNKIVGIADGLGDVKRNTSKLEENSLQKLEDIISKNL